ncbi:hypothetical protein B0H13DRAFT_1972946, partial [Mycena leptocephala]
PVRLVVFALLCLMSFVICLERLSRSTTVETRPPFVLHSAGTRGAGCGVSGLRIRPRRPRALISHSRRSSSQRQGVCRRVRRR